MTCAWKENWEETRQHFVDYWNRDGFLVGAWGAPKKPAENGVVVPHEEVEDPGPPPSLEAFHRDPDLRAKINHWTMAHSTFPIDTIPLVTHEVGPGSLALYLGSPPGLDRRTVWYHPIWDKIEDPESLPPLEFDPEQEWVRIIEEGLRKSRALADGKYLVGSPDLIENIDILASLRDNNQLLMDFVMRPEWVDQKLQEINRAWLTAYERVYNITKEADGSSSFRAFCVWGPGKAAKLQSDASAMISPAMFERFVAPYLDEQCEYLDQSMFHLDGHQCICHLDLLLGIEGLDAIEWTPDPQVPSGGSPEWYGMYRKIIDAGKCIQAIGVKQDEIVPLLEAVGTKGVYILTNIESPEQAKEIEALIAPYRKQAS